MKTTGIVREIDEMGRIVLPIEIRKTKGIEIRDSIEIYIDKDKIILKKYQPGCIFCGEIKDLIEFRNKLVCRECIKSI